MDATAGMNRAMEYIEDNLGGEIDFQKMARIACCSEYHFRRMFSFLAGMSLGEYIRCRRLAAAAAALRDTGEKVIDERNVTALGRILLKDV